MATYAELTDDQRNALDAWLTQARAFAGEISRIGNHAAPLADLLGAGQDVTAAIEALTPGELVPNKSGLAGAVSLTQEEVAAIAGNVQTVVGFMTPENRAMWARAAGSANVVG